MSLTGQPSPRPVLSPGAWYRWTLVSALLALIVVLVVLVTVAATARHPSAPVRALGTARSSATGGVGLAGHRHHALVAGHRPSAAAAAVIRPHLRTAPRTLVRITERRPKPILRLARSSVETPDALTLAPRQARAPKTQKVMGARWEFRPPAQARLTAPNPSPDLSSGDAGEGTQEPEASPEAIFQPQARYPDAAMAEGVTGSVRLKVIVSRRGRVEDAVVVRSSGDDRLDEAASASVRRWRYRPARSQGHPVTGIDYVVVDFYRDDGDRSGVLLPGQ